jgi:hypothetical protein
MRSQKVRLQREFVDAAGRVMRNPNTEDRALKWIAVLLMIGMGAAIWFGAWVVWTGLTMAAA